MRRGAARASVVSLSAKAALLAFLYLSIARAQKLAQPAIGGAIGRIGEHLKAIDRDQTDADHKLDRLALAPFLIGAHDAREAVAVGNANGREPQRLGSPHHLARMRASTQEGEVGGDGQLGVGGHANSPCTNQRGALVSRS